jgi:MFS family permease
MNRVIFITGLVSLFTDLSSEMIVPVLPLYLTAVLHVSTGDIGIIEGIAESTASVLKLFSGWLSDKIGRRKPLMVAGYGFSNLIKPLFALTNSWTQVLCIRFADRFGKGIRGAPRDALIADVTRKEVRGKAFGFHRAMDTLGAALGPLVAFGVLAVVPQGYRVVFWVSAVPGVIATLLLIFFLKEGRKRDGDPEGDVRTRPLPQFGFRTLGKPFVRFTLISTLFALGNSSDAFLILQAQHVGMEPKWIPLAYFLFNVVYSLFAMPAGMLSDRVGRKAVLVGGYIVFAGIYLGFGLVHQALWIWVLFLLYGLYYAATEGIQKAYIADLVAEGKRGMAMGTFNALTGLAALPASILAGTLWNLYGPLASFAVSSVLALMAAVLMLVIRI